MLVVFFGLGVAADSILGGLGRVLEPSQPQLSMIFDVKKHASQKCSSCNKTTVFAMFYRLRNLLHTATKHVFCVAFEAFLDMVHELLQKFLAGIHFLLFKTTLQRGGTCEAHGIAHFGVFFRISTIPPLSPHCPEAAKRAAGSILEPPGLDFRRSGL